MVAIASNGGFKRTQRELYSNRLIASDLRNPDFVRLGESLGLPARRVTSADALGAALARPLSEDRPALIEVLVGEP